MLLINLHYVHPSGTKMAEAPKRKLPAIAMVGVGGGGSRILSEGLEKIHKYPHIDRYACLIKAMNANSDHPHVWVIDTSSDPTTEGFYTNIPQDHKISLSSTIQGMSRGAGGKPGRAAKVVLNEDVSIPLRSSCSSR